MDYGYGRLVVHMYVLHAIRLINYYTHDQYGLPRE